MVRVVACIANEHDYQLVLLAALVCATASLTSFHAYSRVIQEHGSRRMAWAFLTAICTGAGIWATHFVAMLAYNPGYNTAYDPALTIGSLLIAAAAAIAGTALASRGSRPMAAAGGGVIGLGIGFMHFTGMSALIVPGAIVWDRGLVFAALATGILLGSASLVAWHELDRRRALWAAPALLTLAICGLHFTAMGAVTIVPDPTIAVPFSSIGSSTLAIAVSAVAGLVMLALLAMILISRQSEREAAKRNQELVEELRRRNLILQEREAELHSQNRRFELALLHMPHGLCMVDKDRRLVVSNARYARMYDLPPELVRPDTTVAAIVEHRIAMGLVAGADPEQYRLDRLGHPLEASCKTYQLSDGRIIQVTRRLTDDGGWIDIHEDVTERQQLSARLKEQNELLQRREAELEAQNAQLDRALAKVAEQKRNLDLALAHMSQGLAMFDAEERLVLANDRYAAIYGLEAEHLKPGTTLRELIEYRIARGLYPGLTADDVLASTRERLALRTATHLVSKPGDGRTISVSMHPRADGGWVTTLHDMTEREALNARLREQNTLLRQREEELAAQNARFDTAISNMSQGMCLFDAQHRIVFANNRYAEIYKLTPEQVKPGTTIRQVFEARAAERGHTGRDREDYVRQGIERFNRCASQIIELTDGRFISVIRRRMPDGGLLSTHEDITVREKLTTQLARQNELLKEREQELAARNEQLDIAMNNMAQGLAMFDAEERLIVCNRRYADMYNHTWDQVQPGTSLEQLLAQRLASGLYPVTDKQAFIDSWASSFGNASSRTQELSDGRVISVLRRRLGNGCKVTTHEDITERQQLNTRLEEQNRRLLEQEERLRRQNLQLDAALNNMLQGLALFDADLRLVLCSATSRCMG